MKKRDSYFDNVKIVLIFLVVLGHYCESYRSSWLMLGIYDFIYSFHMPLFIFISGYFSKGITCQRMKDIDKLLIPYFFIQLYYIIFMKTIGYDQNWSWAIPIEANWYLLGLFIWRLFVPFLNQVNHPIVIVFLLSLSVGFLREFDNYLNLQRIITFFPFFALGYFSESIFERIKLHKNNNHMIIIAWILLILSMLVFIGICNHSNSYGNFIRKIFIPYKGYKEWFGNFSNFGLIFRGMFFSVATIMSCLFLFIIPARKVWFTSLGERVLYVFLFHMFFVLLLRKYVAYTPFVSESLAIPFSVFITLFFTMKPIGNICDVVLSPLTNHFSGRKKPRR